MREDAGHLRGEENSEIGNGEVAGSNRVEHGVLIGDAAILVHGILPFNQ